MDLMAKKNPKRPETPAPLPEPEKITPVLFRPETASLIRAIDAEARFERRSRNQMIQILLEEALKARGA